MTIHSQHPFAEPEEQRDPLRRFRGRLTTGVALWSTGEGSARAGLTVSSMLLALGEPGRVVGLLDPDSALAESLTQGNPFVVTLLTWSHRKLADVFAFTAPAPGGPFAQASFEDTAWGPRPTDAVNWLGARVESCRTLGWSREVVGVVEEAHVDTLEEPLVHHRGRWVRPPVRES